jgi:hypothetical protein
MRSQSGKSTGRQAARPWDRPDGKIRALVKSVALDAVAEPAYEIFRRFGQRERDGTARCC